MKTVVPWVFYIDISIRRKWFSYWWKTRGANYLEVQLWIFQITIGMPWLDIVIDSHLRDYGSLKYIEITNETFKKRKLAIFFKG